MKLLQDTAAHAEQLISFLQLGKMDQLEIQLPDGRVVLQSRSDRLIFVRVSNPEESHES